MYVFVVLFEFIEIITNQTPNLFSQYNIIKKVSYGSTDIFCHGGDFTNVRLKTRLNRIL